MSPVRSDTQTLRFGGCRRALGGRTDPMLEGLEQQLSELQLVAGSGERRLVGGLESRPVLGQQRVADRGGGGPG